MTIDPYADFRADGGPKEDAFAKLNELVVRLTQAEIDVANAQKALKTAQEQLRQLDEFDIPAYMDELGLSDFTTKAGVKIEVKSTIRASIGKRKAEAYAWLLKNNHSGLIKRTVMVAFNAAEGKSAEALLKELVERNLGAGAKQEMKVEAASLTAWARRQLKDGHEVPADIFGIYDQRSTKVTLPE